MGKDLNVDHLVTNGLGPSREYSIPRSRDADKDCFFSDSYLA